MRRNEHLREHHVTLWSLVGLVPGYTESELAWPRTYRARRHSLTGGGWPVAVAAIAVFRIEALPSRARPTPICGPQHLDGHG
jgi:hypothetical protein